jgi:hypothetical protein
MGVAADGSRRALELAGGAGRSGLGRRAGVAAGTSARSLGLDPLSPARAERSRARDRRMRRAGACPSTGLLPLPVPVIVPQTVEMARNVLCLLGRHHWVERQNEDRETYTECSRCGKYRPDLAHGSGGYVPPPGGGSGVV